MPRMYQCRLEYPSEISREQAFTAMSKPFWGANTWEFQKSNVAVGDDDSEDEEENESLMTPKQKLRKSIDSLIGTVTVVLYFVISFATGAWGITWVLFLISGAVKGLVSAILDLKEASKHEN